MADDTALLAVILPLSILGTLIALAVALPILLRRYCYKCWNDIFCYECCRGTTFCMDCCGGQDAMGCDCPCGPVVEDYPKPGQYPPDYIMGQPKHQFQQDERQPPGFSDRVPPYHNSNPNIHTSQPSYNSHLHTPNTPTKNVGFSDSTTGFGGSSTAPTAGSSHTAFQNRLNSDSTVPSEPYPSSILSRPSGPVPQTPAYEMSRSSNTGMVSARYPEKNGLHYGDSWSSAEIDLPHTRLLSNITSTRTQRQSGGGLSRVTSTSNTRGTVPILEHSMSSAGDHSVPPTPPKNDYPSSYGYNPQRSNALPPPITQAPSRPPLTTANATSTPSWKPVIPSGWQYQPLNEPTYAGPTPEVASTGGMSGYTTGGVNINQGIYVSSNNDGFTTSTTRVTTQQERKVVMLSSDY